MASSEDRDPGVALLRRWQEGSDLEALDELLRLEVGILKRRLSSRERKFDGDAVSASDIAQETVVRFLEVNTAPKFDSPAQLRAYLWTAARRLLFQRMGRNDRHALRLDAMDSSRLERGLSTSGGRGLADRNEQNAALEIALNLLKPAEGEILRLVYFENLGISGAAEKLGLARDAANTRLVRARRELARKLCRWEETVESP
jgi:RNA polymerase sigma factor (sigma-70 family)